MCTYFRLFSTSYNVPGVYVRMVCVGTGRQQNKINTWQPKIVVCLLTRSEWWVMSCLIAKCPSCCCSCLHIKEPRRAFCLTNSVLLIVFLFIEKIYCSKCYFSADATCWTYSHHCPRCQIADKNPSKRWNGEFRGFRTCIGWISTTRFFVVGFYVLD